MDKGIYENKAFLLDNKQRLGCQSGLHSSDGDLYRSDLDPKTQESREGDSGGIAEHNPVIQ